MNQYGAMALNHWRTFRPRAFRQIEDPNSFFSTLGERVAAEIGQMARDLAGPDHPGEGYLAKLGRLNNARMTAEEVILREQVLVTPEDEREPTEPAEPNDETEPTDETDWIPLREDPTHPFWQQVADEEGWNDPSNPPTPAP